jgi:hypothetical protein
MQELRESGIDVLVKKPWATQFCNFYETKQDLLDTWFLILRLDWKVTNSVMGGF